MDTFRIGSTGSDVRELQRKLKVAGFDPGLIDGEYGYGTEAAVLAFQKSEGLLADGRSRFNSSPNGHPFDLYDNRKDLGNQGPPDGERFRGRGYIQLTGRFNYGKYGGVIGLGDQLVQSPERATDPRIAAQLLAAFLKDKEVPIKEALRENDLRAARRLVNGGVHGLDRFAEAYTIGLGLIV